MATIKEPYTVTVRTVEAPQNKTKYVKYKDHNWKQINK